ncbi:hypothetical protein B0O99DRAFT_618148 [Bisporella sp. PMI_857]|nr:hypothetical protein B0O99DRAFT_618148 [Bisporella sp. PMI_857]
MPTYLVHGFRWQRPNIRIHIILHDLEDAAPEWIVAPATSITILNSFYSMYDFLPPSNPPTAVYAPFIKGESPNDDVPPPVPPKNLTKNNKSVASLRSAGQMHRSTKSETGLTAMNTQRPTTSGYAANWSKQSTGFGSANDTRTRPPPFNEWSVVKLLEQYNPEDMRTVSQPHAYVGDYMVEVKLGASVTEEMAKYEAKQRAEEPVPMDIQAASGTSGSAALSSTREAGSPTGMSAREIRRKSRRLGWFEKLRDGLQKGEDIGWHVVVCGDEERTSPSLELHREEIMRNESEEHHQRILKSGGRKGFFGRKKSVVEE